MVSEIALIGENPDPAVSLAIRKSITGRPRSGPWYCVQIINENQAAQARKRTTIIFPSPNESGTESAFYRGRDQPACHESRCNRLEHASGRCETHFVASNERTDRWDLVRGLRIVPYFPLNGHFERFAFRHARQLHCLGKNAMYRVFLA